MRRSLIKIIFISVIIMAGILLLTACNITGSQAAPTLITLPEILAPSQTPSITPTPTATLLAQPTSMATPRPTLDVNKTTPRKTLITINQLQVPGIIGAFFDQASHRLAVINNNGIKFYDPSSLKLIKTYDTRRVKDDTSNNGSTDNISFSLSNNGEWLALGQWEHYVANGDILQRGVISVVQVGTGVTKILGQEITPGVMAAPFIKVQFLPDNQQVAGEMDESNGEVHVWNIDNGTRLYSVNALNGLASIDFSADKTQFAICDHNGYVKLLDIPSARLLKSLIRYNTDAQHPICLVSFNIDGDQLAYATDDQLIHFWNKVDYNSLHFLPGQENTVNQIAFSPDNQSLASSSIDGEIRVWSIKAHKQIFNWIDYKTGFNWLRFTPDTRYLIAGGTDHRLHIWKADGGQYVAQISGEDIAFSPDGKLMVSYSADGSVSLWDLNELNR